MGSSLPLKIDAAILRAMKTETVIEKFGSQQAVAAALGIKQPSVAVWGEYPPDLRQLQIEVITLGALKAEAYCDKYRLAS